MEIIQARHSILRFLKSPEFLLKLALYKEDAKTPTIITDYWTPYFDRVFCGIAQQLAQTIETTQERIDYELFLLNTALALYFNRPVKKDQEWGSFEAWKEFIDKIAKDSL